MSLPIGDGDEVVDLGVRVDGLPEMYLTHSHPQHTGRGRSFYYMQDTTLEGMRRVAEIEDRIQIPLGPEKEALDLGFLKMGEGDTVYVRSTFAPADGSKDTAVCWVTGGQLFSIDQKDDMLAARDRCLGDRKLRSRTKPVKQGSTFVGGSAIERNSRANAVTGTDRCYSVGNAGEPFTNIMAPCKDNKVYGDPEEEALQMRRDLLKAGTSMGMSSMKAGPPEIMENIEINGDLLNVPRTGDKENLAYSAAQVNMAPAEAHGSNGTLAVHMGIFGNKHRDKKDNAGYYTHMSAMSDLPEGYDPGRFFIIYPGVFITLDNYVCINFSGLRSHGGTPPTAPAGADPADLEWAMRFVLILYPPNRQTMGDQRYALAGMPDNSAFIIPPEFTQAKPLERKDRGWCGHAAYAEDGHIVQAREAHADFFARSMYAASLYFKMQMPEEYAMEIDMNAFLTSFSIVDEDGRRRQLLPWNLGPGKSRTSTTPVLADGSSSAYIEDDFIDQAPKRAAAFETWLAYYRHAARHIPYAVTKSNGAEPLTAAYFGVIEEEEEEDDDDNEAVEEQQIEEEDADSDGEPEVAPKEKEQKGSPGGRPARYARKRAAGKDGQPAPKRQRRAGKAKEMTVIMVRSSDFVPTTTDLCTAVSKPPPPPPAPSMDARKTRNQARLMERFEDRVDDTFQPGLEWREVIHVRRPAEEPDIVKRNRDNTPTFLAEMTLDRLTDEFDNVNDSIIAVISEGNITEELQALDYLNNLQNTITDTPLDMNTLFLIQNSWRGLQVLDQHSHRSSLVLRKQHAAAMLFNYVIWYWLDVYMANIVTMVLDGQEVTTEKWLLQLVSGVEEVFELKIASRTFIAVNYGLNLPDVQHTISTDTWPRSQKSRDAAVTSAVIEILQSWLKYPTQSNARPQAWFIHVIVTQFGVEMLYLEHIWRTHSQMVKNLFRKGTWHLQPFMVVKPLLLAAPTHPLFDTNSEERTVVHKIADHLNKFALGRFSLNSLPNNAAAAPIICDRLPEELRQAVATKSEAYVRFLQDSMHHASAGTTSTPHFPVLAQKFQEIPDKVMPFREVAQDASASRVLTGLSVHP